MPVIHLPAPLAKRVGKHSLKTKEGVLFLCLEEICQEYPSTRAYLFTDGQLSPFVKVFINGIDSDKLLGLKTSVKTDDELQIVLAVSGG